MCGHPSRSLQATRGWENVRGRRRPLPSCALFQEKLFAALQREGGEILTLTLLPPSLRPQSGIQKSSRSHFCALHRELPHLTGWPRPWGLHAAVCSSGVCLPNSLLSASSLAWPLFHRQAKVPISGKV